MTDKIRPIASTAAQKLPLLLIGYVAFKFVTDGGL